jgi:hypothetical protein
MPAVKNGMRAIAEGGNLGSTIGINLNAAQDSKRKLDVASDIARETGVPLQDALRGVSVPRKTKESIIVGLPAVQQAQPAAAPQPAIQQPTNTQAPQQTPAASLRAQINQPQPRTEQQLLDEISGRPGGLRRLASTGRGNIFQYTDPTTGKTTFSDSVGGAGEWSSKPFNTNSQASQDLQALYNRDAQQRSTVAQKAGLDAAMYPVSGPMVGAADRGQQIQLQRELQQQQPQRQAMGLEALKLQGEIAKAKAGRADADPRKDVWQVAMDNHFPKNEDDPNGSRRAQAQAFMSKIRPVLEMQGITLDPNQLAAGLNLALTEGTNEDGVLDEMKVMNALTKYVGPDFVQLLSRQ